MTAFTEVKVAVDGEAAEAVADVLRPYAYQHSVVLEQFGDESDPDPEALEPLVAVKIYLAGETDSKVTRRQIEEALYYLSRLYPVPAPQFTLLVEADWANAWKRHYHPMRIGKRILILPSWHANDGDRRREDLYQEGDLEIVLDPGMAFGTGLHPTTQMCLIALQDLVRPGDRVLDVGVGSGILSIAAALLGAAEVLGVDTDPVAVKAATENARRNGVADVCRFAQGTLDDVDGAGWNVVVVNILASVIVGLLREDGLVGYVSPGGSLLLSGIIEEQATPIEENLQAAAAKVERHSIRDWVTMVAQMKNASSD